MTVMDLVAFLNARLDEDEATAHDAATAVEGGRWNPTAPTDDIDYLAYRTHIALHDPARVLREVEAKRRILARYEELFTERKAHPHDLALAGALLALDGVVRALAAVWSDHPDYDPAWA